jgi:C1A family cysteine protease
MPGMKRPQEKQYILNYRKDPYDEKDFLYEPKELLAGPLTDASRVDWTSGMSPVKDQGKLGSCVGFAVTAAKEWQEQVEHSAEVEQGKFDHRNNKYYDLSESWVYWMSKKIDKWPGIEGTSIRYAMKVLNKIGVPCEKAWPYDDVVRGNPASWADLVSRWSLVKSYWRITSLGELRDALRSGPVPIGVGVYEEMLSTGNDGIVRYPNDPQYCYGGHAVCAVGYNDEKQLIKFKNSWSKKWGKGGYGYLDYNYIRNFMWDAWAARDMRVTSNLLKGARSLL